MKYIVFELFPEPYSITDSSDKPMVFDSKSAALKEALELHQAMVIPLDSNLMLILQECYDSIGMAKFELGEEWDETNLEVRLGKLLDK